MYSASTLERETRIQVHIIRPSGKHGLVEVLLPTGQEKPNAETDLIMDFSWQPEIETAT